MFIITSDATSNPDPPSNPMGAGKVPPARLTVVVSGHDARTGPFLSVMQVESDPNYTILK